MTTKMVIAAVLMAAALIVTSTSTMSAYAQRGFEIEDRVQEILTEFGVGGVTGIGRIDEDLLESEIEEARDAFEDCIQSGQDARKCIPQAIEGLRDPRVGCILYIYDDICLY